MFAKKQKVKSSQKRNSIAFDLLYAGYIIMLENAKRHCDYLISGLWTDPTIDRPEKNKIIQSIVERYIWLKGCVFCRWNFSLDQDLEDILRVFKIDLRIIVQESIDMNYTGKTYWAEKGIELCHNKKKSPFFEYWIE